jgi:TusA-related sulfurtransferase
MRRHRHLSLGDLHWPLNILKFNKAVHELKPGDEMITRTDDADVVGNLQQLLNNWPGVQFDVVHMRTDYRIRVIKG